MRVSQLLCSLFEQRFSWFFLHRLVVLVNNLVDHGNIFDYDQHLIPTTVSLFDVHN